jgi:hypothetical protein
MWGMFALGAVIGATIAFIARGGLSAWNERDLRARHEWAVIFLRLFTDAAESRTGDQEIDELNVLAHQLLRMEEKPPTSGSQN